MSELTVVQALRHDLEHFEYLDDFVQESVADYFACPNLATCELDLDDNWSPGRQNDVCPASVKIGVQRIDNKGVQTFVKQESEDVVAVVSGSLKPYFYFVFRTGTAANCLQQGVEALCIVWDGEDVCQDFAFRAEDEAVVLVLSNVNTHADHNDTSGLVLMLDPQNTLLL